MSDLGSERGRAVDKRVLLLAFAGTYLAGDTGRNPCGRDLEYGDLPFGNPVVHDRGDAR